MSDIEGAARARVEAGRAAKETLHCVIFEECKRPTLLESHYLRKVVEGIFKKFPEIKEVMAASSRLPRMTEEESEHFESRTMEFGKYAGDKVQDVPIGYLDWLAKHDFMSMLSKYLMSERARVRYREAVEEFVESED